MCKNIVLASASYEHDGVDEHSGCGAAAKMKFPNDQRVASSSNTVSSETHKAAHPD
jgi:hypothetical protein